MKKLIKKYPYDLIIICFLLTLVITLSILFPYPYKRIIFSIKNLFESLYCYFLNCIHAENIKLPTNFFDLILINNSLTQEFNTSYEFYLLPKNYVIFQEWIKTSLYMFIDGDYFKNSISFFAWLVENINIILLFVTFFVLFGILFDTIYFSEKDPTKLGITRTLKRYRKFSFKFFVPVKNFFKHIISLFEERIIYRKVLIVSLGFFSLLLSISIETFSFALVILSSFRLDLIYPQIYSALYSFFPVYKALPKFIWVILILLIFNFIRKKLAIKKLSHHEHFNEDYVDKLGVFTIIDGEPGKGKTTTMVDMALTSEKLYRYRLFDILKKYESYFPHFNFSEYRSWINKKCNQKQFVNRVQLNDFLDNLKHQHKIPIKYDIKRYGFIYYDELKVYNLFDVLKIYGDAYFLYKSNQPLLFSHLPIYCSLTATSADYLKSFTYDFFTENEKSYKCERAFSHVLNFDTLRLGRKIVDPLYNMECATIVITEIDKERGNQFDKQGLRRDDIDANLLNDLFNPDAKLTRHQCTIDNYPFLRYLCDLQRLQSLNCDLTELAENVVYIGGNVKEKIALSFFTYDSIICEAVIKFRNNFFKKFYSTRNYTSLFSQFINLLTLPFVRYYTKSINQYKYRIIELTNHSNENNVTNKVEEATKYYLSNKKIFSNRFATDCYSPYFANVFRQNSISQDDAPTYINSYMTDEELNSQHSYMIRNLQAYDSFKAKGEDSNDDLA